MSKSWYSGFLVGRNWLSLQSGLWGWDIQLFRELFGEQEGRREEKKLKEKMDELETATALVGHDCMQGIGNRRLFKSYHVNLILSSYL